MKILAIMLLVAGPLLADSITGGGGSATPGGSPTQVQYSNAGAFGGIAGVTTDGTNLIDLKVVADPSAPSSTFVTSYLLGNAATSSPGVPKFFDADLGFATSALYPFAGGKQPTWGCLSPNQWGGGVIATGAQGTTATTGTLGAAAWASTNALTRSPNATWSTAATANLNAGTRQAALTMWRGSSSGLGGFLIFGSFAIVTSNSTQRVQVGLLNSTSAPTATNDPSACTDCFYIGADAATTTLGICGNDNSGTAVCTDLGSNFPAKTAAAFYDYAFWATPNASQINYAITRLDSAQTATGSISTSGNLPRNTVQLTWINYTNSGGNSTVTTIEFNGLCWVANT